MGHTLKLIVLFCLTLISCADNSHQDRTSTKGSKGDTTFQTDTANRTLIASATNSANNDTLIIEVQAAVFIYPDSLKIEKQKKLSGEEAFYVGADDYMFYMGSAHEFLDSVKLTILDGTNKRFLKFIRSDKTQQIVHIDKLKELWSIYFFDPSKKAKQVDMTAIDEEYKSYFK